MEPRRRETGRYLFASNPVANPKSVVGGSGGAKYRLSVLTERLVRYEWSDNFVFEDKASTLAIFRDFEPPEFKVKDEDGEVTILTSIFTLTCNKTGFEDGGLQVKVGADTWVYNGESFGDLNGTTRTLDGADGRIVLEPGILSRRSFSVLDDSKSMLFGRDGWIATRGGDRKDGYVFAHNGDYKAVIKDFYALSGHQPLLPRWALGNWWSRYHEYTADEYKALMDRFQDEDIPFTVAVLDMDWHKVRNIPEGYNGWTGYSWNRELFPNPQHFLRSLRRRGLKVTVNDHPADGIRAFEDLYQQVAKALNHDTSQNATIEFDCTDRKFLDAYFDVLKKTLEDQGIDFWWIDWQQGDKSKLEGVDPLWVLNHYHYLTSKRNIPRLDKPLTFSRYAGPGSHRYPIGFSGDTVVSWASLKFQPEFTATASNIGYGWWSHDIGGHMWGTRSNEMMVRWVQLGCFSPILRLHCEKSQWVSKEPWNYEPEAYRALKASLIFRHRLIPYLYTMNVRASYDDEPLIQPMYWSHSDRNEAYSVPNQYYFGPQLIVAPITSPSDKATLMSSVRAWLPPSKDKPRGSRRFIDIFNPRMAYDNGRFVTLNRKLDQIPVLAPEGTIFPIQMSEDRGLNDDITTASSPIRHSAPKHPDIHIKLVVGADAEFELLEEPVSVNPDPDADDALRPPLHAFTSTKITWQQKLGVLTIKPNCNSPAKDRKWCVELVGVTNRTEVQNNLALAGPEFRIGEASEERYNQCGNSTLIMLQFLNPIYYTRGAELFLGKDLQLDVVDIEAVVKDVLYRCEMGYNVKRDIWALVMDELPHGSLPVEERVNRFLDLPESDVSREVKDAIMEVWTADSRSKGSAHGVRVEEQHDGDDDEDIAVSSVDDDTLMVHRKHGDSA